MSIKAAVKQEVIILYEPAELFASHGKSDKAKNILGWQPKMKFEELAKMMVGADIVDN